MQKSLFKYQVNPLQFQQLEKKLLAVIDEAGDRLRYFRVAEPTKVRVKQYGKFRLVDFEGALVA